MGAAQQILLGEYGASSGGDPYFGYVSALLHMDNVGGSFTDVTGKTWTASGATITSAHPAFGSGGGDFTGTTNRITTPAHADFNFGAGDFTIQYWKYCTVNANFSSPLSYGYTTAGGILLQDNGTTGKLGVYLNGVLVCTESTAGSLSTLNFYEINRSGTNVSIRRNGVVTATGTSSASISNTASMEFGSVSGGGGHGSIAWYDDLRITKGICRNDAVPTVAFPDSGPRAVCTITHAVTLNDTTDGAVNTLQNYTTGAFTPAANDLLVVIVGWTTTGAITGGTIALSNSAGLAFTQILTRNNSPRQTSVYVANALAAASSQTITAGCTPTGGANAAGCNITVIRISGMAKTGGSAVRQSVTPAVVTAGNTPAATFSLNALTNNPVIAAITNASNPAGMTEPSTFTELNDSGIATPNLGVETAGVASGFTGTTVTWGSTTATSAIAAILELDNT